MSEYIDRIAEARRADWRKQLVKSCPVLHVGDVWQGGAWGLSVVTILGFSPIDDWPWPAVNLRYEDGRTVDWGAPAFIHARLVTRGDGNEWHP